jgi:hypothetical protein
MTTPEERAAQYMRLFPGVGAQELIALAIRESVEEEREACILAVGFSNNAVAAIRARSHPLEEKEKR